MSLISMCLANHNTLTATDTSKQVGSFMKQSEFKESNFNVPWGWTKAKKIGEVKGLWPWTTAYAARRMLTELGDVMSRWNVSAISSLLAGALGQSPNLNILTHHPKQTHTLTPPHRKDW